MSVFYTDAGVSISDQKVSSTSSPMLMRGILTSGSVSIMIPPWILTPTKRVSRHMGHGPTTEIKIRNSHLGFTREEEVRAFTWPAVRSAIIDSTLISTLTKQGIQAYDITDQREL